MMLVGLRPWAALAFAALFAAPLIAKTLPSQSLKVEPEDAVWDASRSRFYVTTGPNEPKWPSSIIVVNPETALVEDSISIPGSTPNRLALSGDGQYLYVGVDDLHVVRRYHLPSHSVDLEIAVPSSPGMSVVGLAVPVGQPESILVLRSDHQLLLYDGAVARGRSLQVPPTNGPTTPASLYVRADTSTIYAYTQGRIFTFEATPTGLVAKTSMGAFPYANARITWSGSMATDASGYVIDLDQQRVTGRVALPFQEAHTNMIAESPASVLAIGSWGQQELIRYSTTDFLQVQADTFSDPLSSADGDSNNVLRFWGTDGLMLSLRDGLVFLHTSGLSAVSLAPKPTPTVDTAGVIHLPLPTGDLLYDAARDQIWASVKGFGGSLGNHLVTINPHTGSIGSSMNVGSEPTRVVQSDDGQRLFVALSGTPAVVPVRLDTLAAMPRYQIDQPPIGSSLGNMVVADLVPVPGNHDRVTVASRTFVTTDLEGVTATYDSAGSSPQSYSGTVDVLLAGDTSDALFGYGFLQGGTVRLKSNQNGISFDKNVPSLSLSFNSRPVFFEGRWFSDRGAVYNADLSQLLGAASLDRPSMPVVFPGSHVAVYVARNNLSDGVAIRVYDLKTFLPLSSLNVSAKELDILSATRVGDAAIAFRTANEVVIVPLSIPTSSPEFPVTFSSVAPGLDKSTLKVNAIQVSATGDQLVLTSPSADLNLGNSVLTFDPLGRRVLQSTLVGSSPTYLQLSPDGVFAYAYLSDEGTIARVNLKTQQRDLRFAPDPTGNGVAQSIVDMKIGPDGGLAVSYPGGVVAMFDDAVPRPTLDANNDSMASFSEQFQLVFNATGSRLYGYGQFVRAGLKQWSVSAKGVQPFSVNSQLSTSYAAQVRYARGLLYTAVGNVIEPETARRIGQFQYPGLNQIPYDAYIARDQAVLPDPSAGRVYFLFQDKLLVYDMYTYALIGTMDIPPFRGQIVDFVRWGDDGLAFNTYVGDFYLIKISAVTLLDTPVPSTLQPLPSSAGVATLDLPVADLAYDPSRDLIYASVLNSAGELGDHIATIDPSLATVTSAFPSGPNPNLLALSDDQTRLYFTMGLVNNGSLYVGEGIRRVDLSTGTIGPQFGVEQGDGNYITNFPDLTVLPGQPDTLAVVRNQFGNGHVSIYDGSVKRPVSANDFYLCTSLEPSSTAARLYCYNGYTSDFRFSRLAVDSQGVHLVDSSGPALINGPQAEIQYYDGLVYSSNGRVVDPEAFQLVGQVQATGRLAVDATTAYWVELVPQPVPAYPQAVIHAFDRRTLAPLYQRTISLQTNLIDALSYSFHLTRPVPLGNGRIAFGDGLRVYIVSPLQDAPTAPVFSASGLTNAASFLSGASEGSLVSLFGQGLVRNLNGIVTATQFPLPKELAGTSVTIGGQPAPILAVGNTNGTDFINFQMPYGLAGHGSLPLVVRSGGLSSAVNVQVLPAQPGVFVANGQPAVLDTDYHVVSPDHPAQRGGIISIYCTGLGAVTPAVVAGEAASLTQLSRTAPPSVSIGGHLAEILYSGLAPGYAGLYAINVRVPGDLPAGPTSIVVTMSGSSSPPVPISLQ